jgi:DnaJ-class molecular chaperone
VSTRTSGQATRRPPGLPAEDSRIVVCSFCHGTGKDPFGILSAMSTCCVCRGKGVLRMDGPYRSCPHCDGSGAVKTFTCGVCRGSGYIPEAVGPTATCPECKGTGDEHGDPALACLRCRGRGRVSFGEAH